MLGLSIEWLSELKHVIPWVSFAAGFGGSLHCVGMCGGLVTASCSNSKDIVRYQLGRLLGYLLLGLLAGTLASFLNFKDAHPLIALIPSLMIGGLFIFWGIQSFRGRRAELPLPKFLSVIYQKLWKRFVKENTGFTRSLLIGFISILLPCGLLYGVVLGSVALQSWQNAMLGMFFFWLGTVPSMVMAPGLIQKILSPLKKQRPKVFALCLVLIGVSTITFRSYRQLLGMVQPKIEQQEKHHCH
ncbi:MAG: sulfite exporter TauE/SafE family protein [Bacteriovoracaceae bacterium]|nr:sulfite exporter TauE/SafE family protein [Bacteriovoracaceae bacterium]